MLLLKRNLPSVVQYTWCKGSLVPLQKLVFFMQDPTMRTKAGTEKGNCNLLYSNYCNWLIALGRPRRKKKRRRKNETRALSFLHKERLRINDRAWWSRGDAKTKRCLVGYEVSKRGGPFCVQIWPNDTLCHVVGYSYFVDQRSAIQAILVHRINGSSVAFVTDTLIHVGWTQTKI